MFRALIILLLWIFFVITLIRAMRKGRLLHTKDRRLWLTFFLSILACTFWGQDAELLLDQHFNFLPVALYLKYICLIAVCHLYWQMLKDVGAVSDRQLLDFLAPVTIVLGLMSFAVHVQYRVLPLHELRFVVIGARDAVILLFILFGLYRGILGACVFPTRFYSDFRKDIRSCLHLQFLSGW